MASATHNIHLAESRGCPGAASAELADSGWTPRARRSSGWKVADKNVPPAHGGGSGAGWGALTRSPSGAWGSARGPQSGGASRALLCRTRPDKAFRSGPAACSIEPSDPAGKAGPRRRGPEGSGRVTGVHGSPWTRGEGCRDRRRGGGAPFLGRRLAGTRRWTCARGKLQPPTRARTGARRELPGALTPGSASGPPSQVSPKRRYPGAWPRRGWSAPLKRAHKRAGRLRGSAGGPGAPART